MEKLALVLVALLGSMAMVHAIDQDPQSVLQWAQQLNRNPEILSTLHFYLHDTVSGNNPTAVPVAQAQTNTASFGSFGQTNSFGSLFMMDDILTDRPDSGSTIVGRAQGIYASASMGDMGLLMTLNFVFIGGVYNGSTLSVLGRNPIFQNYREMPIVGGSGAFRMAHGVATARTYSSDPTGNAIVEYSVVVKHY